MDSRQLTAISPIPLTETRARFARRLQQSRQRGLSPLVRTNSDPSLNVSQSAAAAAATDSETESSAFHDVSVLEVQKESLSQISLHGSPSLESSQPCSHLCRTADSGYVSKSKLAQIREDMILESTATDKVLAMSSSPGSMLASSSSVSAMEELKLSQLQGTSTPRSGDGEEGLSKTPNRLRGANAANINHRPARDTAPEEWPLNQPSATSSSFRPENESRSNPFDSVLLDSLHTTYSPSIFQKVVSPGDQVDTPSRGFRWSIDHLAILHPAEIDEFPVHQDAIENDPQVEAQLQRAIDKFWSQKYVAPSPMESEPRSAGPCSSVGSTATPARSRFGDTSAFFRPPDSASAGYGKPLQKKKKILRHVESQTVVTFPPGLDLVKLLGDCFVYNEETGSPSESADAAANLSLNSLRRKLFANPALQTQTSENGKESDCSAETSASSSLVLAPEDRGSESPVFFDSPVRNEPDSSTQDPWDRRRGSFASGPSGFRHFSPPGLSPIRSPGEGGVDVELAESLEDVPMLNSTEYFNDE